MNYLFFLFQNLTSSIRMPRVSLIIKMDLKEQANFLPKQRFASIVSL